MPEKFTRFDVTDYLQTPLDMSTYLKACKEEDSGDGSLTRLALKDVTHTISTRIQRDPVPGITNRSRYTLSKRRAGSRAQALVPAEQGAATPNRTRSFYLSPLIRLNTPLDRPLDRI